MCRRRDWGQIMMIGSLDILGGKAVQLQQGDRERKIYEKEDVLALAKDFSLTGRIAVIDLDAAFSQGDNRELISKLCRDFEVHVGGGIRDYETAQFYLKAGARKLIIGTQANEEFLSELHPENLLVALDMKKEEVVDEAWTRGSGEHYLDRAKRLLPYCSGFLVTQVEKEGLMGGFDFGPLEKLRELTNKQIIAAGGISTQEEIKKLATMNIDCQLGMSIYSGKLDLKDSFVSLADWDKGLLPTIVQDEAGQILMVGFSNEESLTESLKRRKACFYSRSRQEFWMKGETSGNVIELERVFWDCDRDTLIFKGRPTGPSCHFGSYSCFDERDGNLWRTLAEDIRQRDGADSEKSWTKKLLADKKLLASKISEEGLEVAEFRDWDNLRWEVADLFYHVAVLMHREGLTLDDVEAELNARRKI
jgi:phosphoribosyl-ATP pyrophosphohydrolase/phosphoribosyl-AMP cyclohydrolase